MPAFPPSSILRQAQDPLPNYLRETEPLEIEAVPLQLALLTMEVRAQREALQRLAAVLELASRMTTLPAPDDGP